MNRTAFVLAAALSAFGCESWGEDPTCAPFIGTTPVQYVGHAFGRGEVTLRRAGGERVEGIAILRGDTPNATAFELPATGTCKDGVARLYLGAGSHPASETRVLGGRLVLVNDGELLGERFGMWRAEVKKKDGEEVRRFHGYLRQLTEEERAPVAVNAP